MPTVACLIFTAVNTRRAARVQATGDLQDQGSLRAFTFSELVEAIIQLGCTLLQQQQQQQQGSSDEAGSASIATVGIGGTKPSGSSTSAAATGAEGPPLSTDAVSDSIANLLETVLLPRVRREDIRGFREALRGSASLVAAMEANAPMLRAVHSRYALKAGEREAQHDDSGGLGLPLSRCAPAQPLTTLLRATLECHGLHGLPWAATHYR